MKSKDASKREKPSRIPVFNSIEEEAEFWDTHSLEDFADELEEVDDFRIDAIRSPGKLTLFLDENKLRSLEEKASEHGVNIADLVFQWIDEGLASHEKPSARRNAS